VTTTPKETVYLPPPSPPFAQVAAPAAPPSPPPSSFSRSPGPLQCTARPQKFPRLRTGSFLFPSFSVSLPTLTSFCCIGRRSHAVCSCPLLEPSDVIVTGLTTNHSSCENQIVKTEQKILLQVHGRTHNILSRSLHKTGVRESRRKRS